MSTEDSVLAVPMSGGIKSDDVADIVHFDWSARGDAASAIPSTATTGAGVVLVAKVADALVHMGYGDEDVQKVAGLVARNSMTGESTHVEHEDIGLGSDLDLTVSDAAQQRVTSVLKGLLDKNIPRSRCVTMNSNEPVVLINHSTRIAAEDFSRIVDETVMQLQHGWNIWPVRVYAGPYVVMPDDGFSITLLNVVNTDIGGPSMVQLLDAPGDAPRWDVCVRREAWREKELLSREEKSDEDTAWDDASEHSMQSAETGSLNIELEPSTRVEPGISGQDQGPLEETSPASQDSGVADEADISLEEPEPQETPLSEEESLPERRIEHPTWERRHDSMSLLDLIRSQASILVPFGKEEPAMEETPKNPAESPKVAVPSDNSDEFVLV